MLRAHRAAALDPYTREVHAAGALVVRVGYGSGDQVADGQLRRRLELPRAATGRSADARRAAGEMLAPQERLAAMLAGREAPLAGVELLLRARADLDAERPREAALQARVALEALIAELGREGRDVAELSDHRKADRRGGERGARRRAERGARRRRSRPRVDAMDRALRHRAAGG